MILTVGNYNARAMLFNSVGSDSVLDKRWPGFPDED